MSPSGSDAQMGPRTVTQRTNLPRLAVIDQDPGFMQVLSKRADALGWELRVLGGPVRPEGLVMMRLNALLVDVELLGQAGAEYLERVCQRLPSLAVVVCTGPTTVAQRVRGLRLGADAWVTNPCHPGAVSDVDEVDVVTVEPGVDPALAR